MDKGYTRGHAALTMLLMALIMGSGCVSEAPQEPVTTTSLAPASTTSSTTTATTASTTYTTSTTTSSASTSSTQARFVRLSVDEVEKCKQTVLGKMNRFIAQVPQNVGGSWAGSPTDAFRFSCDGSEERAPDIVVYRGGNSIEKGNPLAGSYRFMVKCGHNALSDDLMDCRNLTAGLDAWAALNVTGIRP